MAIVSMLLSMLHPGGPSTAGSSSSSSNGSQPTAQRKGAAHQRRFSPTGYLASGNVDLDGAVLLYLQKL